MGVPSWEPVQLGLAELELEELELAAGLLSSSPAPWERSSLWASSLH